MSGIDNTKPLAQIHLEEWRNIPKCIIEAFRGIIIYCNKQEKQQASESQDIHDGLLSLGRELKVLDDRYDKVTLSMKDEMGAQDRTLKNDLQSTNTKIKSRIDGVEEKNRSELMKLSVSVEDLRSSFGKYEEWIKVKGYVDKNVRDLIKDRTNLKYEMENKMREQLDLFKGGNLHIKGLIGNDCKYPTVAKYIEYLDQFVASKLDSMSENSKLDLAQQSSLTDQLLMKIKKLKNEQKELGHELRRGMDVFKESIEKRLSGEDNEEGEEGEEEENIKPKKDLVDSTKIQEYVYIIYIFIYIYIQGDSTIKRIV